MRALDGARRLLVRAAPRVRVARLRQTGTFATKRNAWAPFHATEVFTVSPPGFVWDARIRMLPFASVRVRDGYRDGTGTMLGRVAAVLARFRTASRAAIRHRGAVHGSDSWPLLAPPFGRPERPLGGGREERPDRDDEGQDGKNRRMRNAILRSMRPRRRSAIFWWARGCKRRSAAR